MQADAFADQLGRQEIAFKELPSPEDRNDDTDRPVIRPELHQRHADGQHTAGEGPGIGDEGERAGEEPDRHAEVETGE